MNLAEALLRTALIAAGGPELDPDWLGQWQVTADVYPCGPPQEIWDKQATIAFEPQWLCQTEAPFNAECAGWADWDAIDVTCEFTFDTCEYQVRVTGINNGNRFWGATYITPMGGSECLLTMCQRWEIQAVKLQETCPDRILKIDQETWGRVKGGYR